MKKFLILLPLLAFAGETNDLGVLTATNQILLGAASYKPGEHYVVRFESLEVKTNIWTLLDHREQFILLDYLPKYMPAGRVQVSIHCETEIGIVCSETNVGVFRILSPAPRMRMGRKYDRILPPMPHQMVDVTPLPSATAEKSYREWRERVESGKRRSQ